MSNKPQTPIRKRPMFNRFRSALWQAIAKPMPWKKQVKSSTRPLSADEKLAILQRASEGQDCRQIASELGIPFALVQHQLERTTNLIGTVEKIIVLTAYEQKAAIATIASIDFSVPSGVYASCGNYLHISRFENIAVKIQAEFNGENFVVLHIELHKGDS